MFRDYLIEKYNIKDYEMVRVEKQLAQGKDVNKIIRKVFHKNPRKELQLVKDLQVYANECIVYN